jgi:hypothetical protein
MDFERIVYVFRHKERYDFVSVYNDRYDQYAKNPDYIHVGTVDPLEWIRHLWKYGNGSVYIYNIRGTSDVIAVTETANWDYENDSDYEFVEEIEEYADWIEKNYELRKGRASGEKSE